MLGIGVDDLGTFFVVEVLHVINRHRSDMTIRRGLHEEPLHHRRDAQQRREGQRDRPLRYVRSGQRLEIDIARRLFIEPSIVQRLALEAFTAAQVTLDTDDRGAAADVPDFDTVEQVRNASSSLLKNPSP